MTTITTFIERPTQAQVMHATLYHRPTTAVRAAAGVMALFDELAAARRRIWELERRLALYGG